MNFAIKKIKILFLLVSFYFNIYSENLNFQFSHLTSNDGLSQSSITCILQDSKGFMWFGTFNGLNRYDGYTFEMFNYDPMDANSISHNYISSMCLDQNKNLWVGTTDGLNQFNYQTNDFRSFKKQNNKENLLSDNQIESILKDSKGRLWIGTRNGGLNLYNIEFGTFEHFIHDENNVLSLSSNRIGELFEDSSGNIWVAHQNGIIDIIHSSENKMEKFLIHRHKISNFPITKIVESKDRSIWISTQGGGLYKLKLEEANLTELEWYSKESNNSNKLNSNIILTLLFVDDANLWIGTENNGINILNKETNSIQYVQKDPFKTSSLNHDSVWEIYKDRSQNIWIGTYGYGLNLLTPGKAFVKHFKHQPGNQNSLSHNMVNSFAENENNNIWIATDGGGLNLYNRKTNTFSYYNSQNTNIGTDVIVSLLKDKQNRLWIGTWTDGLYLFDKRAKNFKQYTQEKNSLGSNRILHILEDKKEGLWISTFYGGLTYFNPDNLSTKVYNSQNSDLSDNNVRVVLQDLENNLWIGTDSGIDYFNTNTKKFTHYKNDLNNPSKGFVHSIVQTKDSTIWIGTTSGLNKFIPSNNEFNYYNISNGLPNNEIKCILENSDGTIWISTNKGISSFNPKSEKFKNYDITDGLQGNEFNIRSGFVTNKNEILFGGNNGFNILDASTKFQNTYVPPVVIRDLKVFNQSVSIGDNDSILSKHIGESEQITLSYDNRVFSIDFAALNFISPEKNQYAYKMEGFDTDWNYVDNNRTASYTNLDPGDYIFKVKASNNDGVWNEEGTEIKIRINPPFWKTWWFYLIESILFIAALAFIANYFISRQRLRNALQIEHLELEKMYELDQMKTQFFSNISHEFHSPMTLILSPLEKLISSQNSDSNIHTSLKLIQRNAKRLQRMTNQLRDFQKIESGELQLKLSRGDIILFIQEIAHAYQDFAIDHSINYQFKSIQDRYIAWFDADKVDKIVYNLLSNAFKFTPDRGEITVCVSIIDSEQIERQTEKKDLANQYIEIEVSDNGVGISDDKIENIFQRYYHEDKNDEPQYQGSGVGLALVYELINLYHGEINVKSSKGKGATFTVQIPLDEHFLEEKQLVNEFNVSSLEHQTEWNLSPDFKNDLTSDPIVLQSDMPVILIVEDDKEILNYIRDSLELKYRIFTAENGKEGSKKATKIIPDLIVSDIKMPEMSGIDLCNKVKDDEKTSHIPIILLTAYTSKEFKLEGLKKGADAYLSKPFNIDELEVQISNLLESRKKLKEKYSRQILLEPTNTVVEDIDEKFLQRVLKTVEKHISDTKFNAEILSKKIGMSRMQLYRKLRGLTGQTVHEFIRSIKLKRAVQLLKEKRMTITEIAYEVGFNDLTYFARCFRQQYKKSPSEFISDSN